MGENLDIPGRLSVRSPMQWTAGKNGGFSVAKPSALVAPVTGGPYGAEHVNAEDQRSDPDSLLSFIGQLARRYRECPEVGMGDYEVLASDAPAVLVHRCTWNPFGGGTSSSVLVHNLAPAATTLTVHVAEVEDGTEVLDLFSGERHTIGQEGRLTLDVGGYGHHWLRLLLTGDRRLR